MSDTATVPPPATEEAGATAPKRSRKLLLIVGGAVLVGVLAGGGYLFLAGTSTEDATAAEPVEEAPVEGEVVEVGTLTTNLGGASGRYARVGIALVLSADASTEVVAERFALVKDAAISEIGRHDAASLASADGTELLRSGLAARIRGLYPDGEVLRVVLTELLIQ